MNVMPEIEEVVLFRAKPVLGEAFLSDTLAAQVPNSRELLLFCIDAAKTQIRADESANISAPDWANMRRVIQRQVATAFGGLEVIVSFRDYELGEPLDQEAGKQESEIVSLRVVPGPIVSRAPTVVH